MILLLAVLHAPTQAQALLADFLPADWIHLGSSEPVTLLLTGLALLSLARVSLGATTAAAGPPRPVRAQRVVETTTPTSTRRAA
jgi:hypothetical protein